MVKKKKGENICTHVCTYIYVYVYTHTQFGSVYIFLEWFICCPEGRGHGKWKSERFFTIYPFVCFEVWTSLKTLPTQKTKGASFLLQNFLYSVLSALRKRCFTFNLHAHSHTPTKSSSWKYLVFLQELCSDVTSSRKSFLTSPTSTTECELSLLYPFPVPCGIYHN